MHFNLQEKYFTLILRNQLEYQLINSLQCVESLVVYGWGQIDEHCWSNMTSLLIIQCCRGWPNCPTRGVQQCVTMCVEQCCRVVCQTNIHLLNNKSNIYFQYFFSVVHSEG